MASQNSTASKMKLIFGGCLLALISWQAIKIKNLEEQVSYLNRNVEIELRKIRGIHDPTNDSNHPFITPPGK